MSTYKCENPECGNVFNSTNPLSCPKCDTLEFSTIHIKSNKKFLVFGVLILLIGTGLFFLLNDESSNTESTTTLTLTESKIETIKFNGGLMYSTTSLNVRIKPNKNSEKVTSLKLNTPVLTNTKDIGGWVLIADTEYNQLGYVKSKYLSNTITGISSNKINKPKQTTKTLAIYRKRFNKEPDYGEYIDVSSSYFTSDILYSRITEVLDSPSHKRYGKLNEGLAYADRYIEMYGESMVGLGHRSEIKYFLGDYIGALSDINKAIEIAKKDDDADYWTARYLEERELIMLEIEETDYRN